jgi:hypothetical protein
LAGGFARVAKPERCGFHPMGWRGACSASLRPLQGTVDEVSEACRIVEHASAPLEQDHGMVFCGENLGALIDKGKSND